MVTAETGSSTQLDGKKTWEVKRTLSHNSDREWIAKKFGEMETRVLKIIVQLDDEQLNWRPNETSHSISTLIRHVDQSIQERIMNGILHHDITSNRDDELRHTYVPKSQLKRVVETRFQFVIDSIRNMTDEELEERYLQRRGVRNLDMLHQCLTHYAEHMGQMFYVAKICLNDKYEPTTP